MAEPRFPDFWLVVAERENTRNQGRIGAAWQATLDFPHPKLLPPGSLWRVDQEDAVSWLRSLPGESADLLVTDPAYESLEKHRAKGTTTRLKVSDASSNPWFPIFPNARFEEFFRQVYRVLKRNAHAYVMTDQETMFVIKPIAEATGFKFWKGIVWDYGRIGMGYHYRSRHQMVCFFEKGKRRLNDLGTPDVLNVPRVTDGYPTEKPAELSRILIRQSTATGELVIDPFCGSGSAGEAALTTGRTFLGCDVSEEAIRTARVRLDR